MCGNPGLFFQKHPGEATVKGYSLDAIRPRQGIRKMAQTTP